SIFTIFDYAILTQPPSFLLLPYTTLFRSLHAKLGGDEAAVSVIDHALLALDAITPAEWTKDTIEAAVRSLEDPLALKLRKFVGRSEEHTSELQSRENLVCRLLLEKKKKKI